MYIYIRANQIHIHVCIMQDTEKVYTQQQCIMQYTWINIHIHLCMYIMYIHSCTRIPNQSSKLNPKA